MVATSALVMEIICHHGGPRCVLLVHPVANLKSPELKNMLLDAISVVK